MASNSLLSKNPAFKQLRSACVDLGVPQATALELVRFLMAKRVSTGWNDVSPSAHMDRLWHWVLLNTAVRQKVDELVGGEVPHSTHTARDSDEFKASRMAKSMSMIEAAGWTPNLAIWRAPHTLSMQLRRMKVYVFEEEGGVDHLYEISAYHWYECDFGFTSESASALAEVTAHLQLRGFSNIHHTGVGRPEWSVTCCHPSVEELPHDWNSPHSRARVDVPHQEQPRDTKDKKGKNVTPASVRRSKRYANGNVVQNGVGEPHASAPSNDKHILVNIVQRGDGRLLRQFRVRPNSMFQLLKLALQTYEGIPMEDQYLWFDGEICNDTDTLLDVGMTDGSTIEFHGSMRGC